MTPLSSRWSALMGERAHAAGRRLIAAWSEPHRRYHSIDHLQAVLDHLDELDPAGADVPVLAAGGQLTVSGAARTAAWYHDAVYRPGAAGNEEASAVMAEAELLALGWALDAAGEVARLVRLTVDHRCDPADPGAALLCDADLAVLGGDPDGYGRYVAAVRAEHAGIDAEGWGRGRAAVLGSLLERRRLFVTPEGAARWEDRARRNMRAELETLAPVGGADRTSP